jgi:hypothetical protein
MLSALELCHIIESALLPLPCTCRFASQGTLRIQIDNLASGHVESFITDISISGLTGGEMIDQLINQIREEIRLDQEQRTCSTSKQSPAALSP